MSAEDKVKFEQMYLEYQRVLRAMAYKNDIPRDDIEDMVQDTFMIYAKYGYDLDLPPDRKKLLLAKILKSRCMDYHRRMKHTAVGGIEMDERSDEDYPFHGMLMGLAEFAVSKERCQAILAEIESMPENWRDVTILKLIEGRPTREVCALLHISEKACYSRISRVRSYLEALLADENWPHTSPKSLPPRPWKRRRGGSS